MCHTCGKRGHISPVCYSKRWAILLSAYTYHIVYHPTKLHANADALSRIPLHSSKEAHSVCYDSIFNLGQVEALPVTCGKLARATSTDPLLSKVMRYTRHGWLNDNKVEDQLKPYFHSKKELTIERNCLMWGIRVIVPQIYQQKVLNELHLDHPGMSRMKSIARSYVD